MYFLNNRSVVGTSIASTQYTQEVLRVKWLIIIFPGKFCCMYKQMVIASGSDNNHVSLRHSPRHFPEGNLVYLCESGAGPTAAGPTAACMTNLRLASMGLAPAVRLVVLTHSAATNTW